MTNDKIQEIYQQFQKDFSLTKMPELQIERTNSANPSAAVSNVKNNHVKLCVGLYFDNYIEKYSESILYHEFVHIWDDIIFFKNVTDDTKRNVLLFPFTEIHSAEVMLLKLLGISSRPIQVSRTKKIPLKSKYVTIEEFLKNERDELWFYSAHLRSANRLDFFWNAMSRILYNIGYIVVLSNDLNLLGKAVTGFQFFDYIKTEIMEMYKLYLTQKPSEELCNNLAKLINSVLNKMITHSGRSDLFK